MEQKILPAQKKTQAAETLTCPRCGDTPFHADEIGLFLKGPKFLGIQEGKLFVNFEGIKEEDVFIFSCACSKCHQFVYHSKNNLWQTKQEKTSFSYSRDEALALIKKLEGY